MMKPPRTALIIGAGPAGLTAALELLERTDIVPLILEQSPYIGGISKTIAYKGNRIDIGGHRFFSKSDRVMQWWLAHMPLEAGAEESFPISYQGKTRSVQVGKTAAPDAEKVMLVRSRQSRIYFRKQFFEYPISLSAATLRKLGLAKVWKIGWSYLYARLQPIRNERSLEDFFINRFGRELYETFFKDYTEKVWGVPCSQISNEWGAQRVKGLSVTKAVVHAAKKMFSGNKASGNLVQKDTETSLIERFLYPRLGPGQLWEEVAAQIQARGGQILHHQEVTGVERTDTSVVAVTARNSGTDVVTRYEADFVFSTMPVQTLIGGLTPAAPSDVIRTAAGLQYRDFMTVGLLLTELKVKDETAANQLIRDNWIYIQESEVSIGRLQIFNNWSPYMVANPDQVWIGLEYFCFKGDALWSKPDAELIDFAIGELVQIGIIDRAAVLDGTVLREEKTYPAYFGTYNNFDVIRQFTDTLQNLFLIGRNGMHKYNNSDHSMLTAMEAVDNLISGRADKANIWAVNTEQDYHEEK
ncbi:MAG: NAD(P)/FAD-dependent oxidoreductase [Sphingobacteriales bacterium]|nr:MAG: NAD(P)/FAD-dependent oxidoreductase [Sphingobacteriales bacterium]